MFVAKKSKSSARKALKPIFKVNEPVVEREEKITVEEVKKKPASRAKKEKVAAEPVDELIPETETK